MNLVEDGNPNLIGQNVFGTGAILGTQFGPHRTLQM